MTAACSVIPKTSLARCMPCSPRYAKRALCAALQGMNSRPVRRIFSQRSMPSIRFAMVTAALNSSSGSARGPSGPFLDLTALDPPAFLNAMIASFHANETPLSRQLERLIAGRRLRRHEHRSHAGRSRPAILDDARAHPPNRSQSPAQAQAPRRSAKAPQLLA